MYFSEVDAMNLSPIILFVYNRPEHTRQTVEALQNNELSSDSVLYIYADGAKDIATAEQVKKVAEVREYIHTITGFKKVIIEESTYNKGLANSVIAGVTKVINEYGKAIVLEDDLVCHRYFLRFMNDCLNAYEQRKDIFMIGGYGRNLRFPFFYHKDVYLVHRSNSWGWATWKDRWKQADWNVSGYERLKVDPQEIAKFNRGGSDMFPMLQKQVEKGIDSWAIRWDYAMYLHDAYCINPVFSFITPIGLDGSGVHCGHLLENVTAPLYNKEKYSMTLPPYIGADKRIEKEFHYYATHLAHYPTYVDKVRNFLLYRI